VQIENLHYAYAQNEVLRGVNLQITRGQIYAILGGNGAGKSTLLKLMLGLLKPMQGSVCINGINVEKQPEHIRAQVAYVPELVAVYPQLSGLENLRYFLALTGQALASDASLFAALRAVDLKESAWHQRTSHYSKGMRQKLVIALALARDMPLLLLDEPSSGLDPAATAELHRLLRSLKLQGMTIIMVTHDLLAVSEIADAFCFIKQGQVHASIDGRMTGSDQTTQLPADAIADANRVSHLSNLTKLLALYRADRSI
jgi:ABC-2 type transport system ATP-binding protein